MALKIRMLCGFEGPDDHLQGAVISVCLFDSYLITNTRATRARSQYSFAC